jgi:hypothetical protein
MEANGARVRRLRRLKLKCRPWRRSDSKGRKTKQLGQNANEGRDECMTGGRRGRWANNNNPT